MENILILDTETTGLNPKTNKLIEIGAIFYNVKSKSVIQQCSTLIYGESNECFHINAIHEDSLKAVMLELESSSIVTINELMVKADVIMAHNAPFDRGFIEEFSPLAPVSRDKKWICSVKDIRWPIPYGASKKLTQIAAVLGVTTSGAHRALSDCTILASCLSKLGDLESQLARL